MGSAKAVVAKNQMVVAKSHGECRKLKDPVQQQDHPMTTMLAAVEMEMASSEQQASSAKEKPPRVSMHPLLAAAACRGNLEELRFLLNREPSGSLSSEFLDQAKAYHFTNFNDDTASAMIIVGQQQAAAANNNSDVEQGGGGGVNNDAPPLPLNSVTVEGDTVLHLVAAHGEAHNFLDCAKFIHGLIGLEEAGLLSMENYNGDTPLHCAARAGKKEMVSCLLKLEKNDEKLLQQLLRKKNSKKETALHEAVRFGDDELVTELLRVDGELACFPQDLGTSPLYLAISLGRVKTAKTLHDESKNKVISYSGPHGQNALHAAVLQGPELTRTVLEWDTDRKLIIKRDISGRTPLHFAAGLAEGWPLLGRLRAGFAQVLEANTAAVYQPDNKGLYPIHVAASVGAKHAVEMIVEKCGGTSAGLRDAKGRTFLHVAVGERKTGIVGYACGNPSLAWIMNMQDNDGNTALHLVVQAGSLRMFSALLGNMHVDLNLANAEEETPLDIAYYRIPPGLFYNQSSESRIRRALLFVGAVRGTYRPDQFKEKYEQIHGRQPEREKKNMENIKDMTQAICIGSVLIATVTFGATFALPGGYIADDHANGGTPTLAGRYAFDVFVVANTFAFTLSSAATVLLIRAGCPFTNTRTRNLYSTIAFSLVDVSVTYLIAAFALAVYVVLRPVAPDTACMACILSIAAVMCIATDVLLNWAILARPLFVRCGALRSLLMGPVLLVGLMYLQFGPFAFVLLLARAAHGWNH